MNVIQSYLTTIMHGDFSLYEVRIFLRIVEQANVIIDKKTLSSMLGKSFCADGVNCNLSVPMRSILADNSQHYDEVKNALSRMLEKKVEYYDTDAREWRKATLINNIRVADGSGLIKFVVPKWLMELILNFVKYNFSEYDLQAALSLPTAYSVRLYWLTCSMTKPVPYSITFLKDMLGVGKRYAMTKDFIKRCIEPPRKILEERNLNGFTFEKQFTGNKCTSLLFKPVKRQIEKSTSLTARASLGAWCNPALRQYLTTQANMRISELSAHKDTLFNFGKIPNWQDKIVRIVNRARKGRKTKGYIFAAIKKEVERNNPVASAQVLNSTRN